MPESAVAARLAEAGFVLPAPPEPKGAYVPAVRNGSLVFTAGQLPIVEGRLSLSGRVGVEVSPEDARRAAALAAVNALAAASTVCDLDEVIGVVRLVGYVACESGFGSQPQVVDGASEVLLAAFGEAGTHAREAVGVAALPLGAPVEVSLVLGL